MKKEKNNNTFNAKVDIVTFPDNIQYYSEKRTDYTELALTAIKQKPNVIKYISSSYKNYSILCKEAINQHYGTFLLINDNVHNYKQLGEKAIMKYPFLVSGLAKTTKHYYYFWELAISTCCYKVLIRIDENKEELFPLVEKVIHQEPLAIFYVNSSIPIYSKLCNIAYNKNKESIRYMDINYVDKYLVFEIIKKEPEKIKYLDKRKEYYKEAQKLALSLNGKLIRYIYYSSSYYPLTEQNLDCLLELINIAEKTVPIDEYSIVLEALCLENRRNKEKILNTPNILGNNIYQLLKEIDDEYELLSKEYQETLLKEIKEPKSINSNFISDCPIKIKKEKYIKRRK